MRLEKERHESIHRGTPTIFMPNNKTHKDKPAKQGAQSYPAGAAAMEPQGKGANVSIPYGGLCGCCPTTGCSAYHVGTARSVLKKRMEPSDPYELKHPHSVHRTDDNHLYPNTFWSNFIGEAKVLSFYGEQKKLFIDIITPRLTCEEPRWLWE